MMLDSETANPAGLHLAGKRDGMPQGDAASLLRPLKHSLLVASAARLGLRAMTRRLERVIFTATTGRSGTKSLASLFSMVPECVSLHEPWPDMSGDVLRAASYGQQELADQIYRRIKSVNILRAAVGYRYYFEANHCFVKTFMEQAIADFDDRIAVVHLVRPTLDVAMSIYQLHEEPGSGLGNSWWLDHRAPTNVIRISRVLDSDPEYSHPFYKTLWYWYEVEARIAAWRASMPAVLVARFETEWLGDRAKVMRLLGQLGIECEEERIHIQPTIEQNRNAREEQKTVPRLPEEQAREMLERFRRLLTGRGIDISVLTAGAS